jgi:3-hydroxyacyl-CoA dehydrogenase
VTVHEIGVVGEVGVLGETARAIAERGLSVVALAPDAALGSLAGCDLVIECSDAGPADKLALLRRIEACVSAGAVVATDVDVLGLEKLASAVHRPAQLLGIRVIGSSSPHPRAELTATPQTAPGALLTAQSFCRVVGWSTDVADAAE